MKREEMAARGALLEQALVPGQRVELDGYLGTIRYHGPVGSAASSSTTTTSTSNDTLAGTGAPPPKLWYGIEWDDPSRGKHDGTHAGTSYFVTRVPGSGSFVLANRPLQVGCGFVQALEERYLGLGLARSVASAAAAATTPTIRLISGEEQGAEGGPAAVASAAVAREPALGALADALPAIPRADRDAVLCLGGDASIPVETVGWEKVRAKQANLALLQEVGLADMHLSHCGERWAGPPLVITDLDLSRNWLRDVAELGHICRQLPHLTSLRAATMAFVPMSDLARLRPALHGAFPQLRRLTLNKTALPWADVLALLEHMPVLQELHVAHNGLLDLGPLGPAELAPLQGLTLLNLEHNALTWEQVAPLGALPTLTHLVLAGNRITALPSDLTPGFASLAFLNLNHNQLTEWGSVHALNTLPGLREVRLKANPVCDAVVPARSLYPALIARLRHVMVLNGSTLLPRDRLDAELYYLTTHAAEKRRLEAADFEAQHPNYAYLEGKYDMITDAGGGAAPSAYAPGMLGAAGGGMGSRTLGERLMPVRLVYHPPTGSVVRMSKQLPHTMTVRALRILLIKCFRLRGPFRLWLVAPGPSAGARGEDATFEEEEEEEEEGQALLDDTLDLAYYGLVPSSLVRVRR